MEELWEALQYMPNKKAPGPYKEFYKEFWPILAPAFQKIDIEVKETCTLPPNMNCANCSP